MTASLRQSLSPCLRAVGAAIVAFICTLIFSPPASAIVPASGVHPREIVVGSLLDLSGPLSQEGIAIRNGLTMAFAEINKKGGINGRRITLAVEDTAYDPARAREAASALLAKRVFAILCSNGTPPVTATMPMVLAQGILHLFPFTSPDDTYVASQPLEFAIALPVAQQIRTGLNAILDMRGALKVGILYRGDAFGRAALAGTEDALAARHLQITAAESYAPGARDFAHELLQLRRAGAELVVIGAVAQETFAALKQAHARGWYPVFLCPEACYVPEVATLGGRAVSGLYAVATTPIPYPDAKDAALRDWVRNYESQFATVASAQAFRAYLDARLFAEALRRSGPNPTQRHFARVLEAMPAWRDPQFGGVPVNYSADDHLGLQSGFLAQIRDGRWISLIPQPRN
ncbi:MAG TPA: ABC transporter substrate-binding protein [Rhizomicrobium sp.]|nr:ABC transporter substrate-binding protein [Rhizomicrobium sp.]